MVGAVALALVVMQTVTLRRFSRATAAGTTGVTDG
jgi:ABC-type enterochelin transport system permease subunit